MWSVKMLLPLVTLCFIATTVTSHNVNVPKVYESTDEFLEPKTNRLPRHPQIQRISKPLLYAPPKYDYKTTVQQDPQLLRYYRQQQVNARNRMETLVRKERIAPVSPQSAPPSASQQKVQPQSLLRVARKLTPSNYNANDMHIEESKPTAASPRIIYVHASKLPPEQNLKALNDLIGKNPNVQLEGLKQLLQDPSQIKLIMPMANGPTPFQANHQNVPLSQHAVDINAAVQANIEATSDESKELVFKPDQDTISKIQAELDASARIQAQKAIAAAQRQALAHVEEQHKAIAKAQEEARRVAMEKVRAHNAAISQVYFHKKEETPISEEVHPTQEAQSRIHTVPTTQQVITVVEEPQQDVALVQAHNEALLATQVQQGAEEHGYHQQQLEVPAHEVLPAHIVYEPVHHSQEELQKLAEESNKAYGGEREELQYAAKYAFGYRVRDYHSGNDYGHEERREGKTAKGHYHVLLPDGRIQNVDYWADPSGYHAKVTYDNVAHHEE